MQQIFDTLKHIALEIHALLQDSNTTYLESTNSTGDVQLQVDVIADKLIEERLLALPSVRGVASEEKPNAIEKAEGEFLIAYDPLDGSSLVDSNLSIGSIFGIYAQDFQGKNLIASAYIIYGPRTEIVFAHKNISYQSYNGKQWIQKPTPKLQTKGKISATGGTQKHWSKEHKALIESFFAAGYRLRYSGGMVPDLHQILIKGGGIFSYPATSDAPKGKLRKLFEVFPFAYIYELCGGEAIGENGVRLLDLPCAHLHDTTPCYFGSLEEIALFKEKK
ncbi:class 1 fructose-bisphosphatase [Helicobacter mustelae]|uniref:Fructose-1,6-bisphosphatase class 1 n=1 Tax=Helicobacter mustelae (strain ATCC 43772 / CCUG 25715 / CIP 103759 / LMG 18044 / NCTC 12198 / R85-136P) TaxID=679897 RepID=D3UFM2_HELM1|nr:class 1 fructose-bisphosphatase [Helicobacter mustelae]CBG39293.1 putative fructose-1,6-bisphosphatase [Helicobacter mustelae 12198]SQH70804.1 fructose-1,6-bisphosphatase [Helicobacter mustelae]STP11929.1 fructose-1,6-bisphosphatase [Helicobacter mustelae]